MALNNNISKTKSQIDFIEKMTDKNLYGLYMQRIQALDSGMDEEDYNNDLQNKTFGIVPQ